MLAYFRIRERQSTVSREVLGGLTTFMAMSYILFVQPAVLGKAPTEREEDVQRRAAAATQSSAPATEPAEGVRARTLDAGGVFMATCIASALACFLMGLLANYPIALAPGMGENFFFVFTLCGIGAMGGALHLTAPEALALTAAVGVIFLLLSSVGLRSTLLNAIPDALKSGIAAGIGLFIALIGFEWGNLIRSDPATFVHLADIHGNYVAGLTLLGLGLTLALMAFHVRGAILIGILATTVAAWGVGALWGVPGVTYHGVVGAPSGLGETAGAFWGGFASLGSRLLGRHALEVLAFGFILLFMDLFDTVGTLVGVANRAGLMQGRELPRAQQALAADAMGTVLGGCLGTSTVTSYIESITGVSSGARTGLASLVTGLCLLAALLFQPLVEMVGGGVQVGVYPWGDPILRYPMIAPALIVVGAMMMRAMKQVEWDDITESLPAFLALVSIPFTFSIATGIAIGFVSYAFGKLISGRARQCPAIVYVFAALFVLQYVVGAVTHAIQ